MPGHTATPIFFISIEVAFVVNDTLVRFYNRKAAETLTYRRPDSSKNCGSTTRPWARLSWLIRSTPLLVQLFIIYFGLPQLGIDLGPYISGVLGLGLNLGAYNAETIRGGIQTIPQGQQEAARSLGMSSALAMRRIILPQALRIIIPPLGNNFVILIKVTSLVSTITLVELTLTAGGLVSQLRPNDRDRFACPRGPINKFDGMAVDFKV